ncbi:MAG: hypothetical protein E7680_05435 [Ruminococcaceae bacterium]|nr:hypothetical protein [Oscillospiraceae bacterium]
MSDYYYSKEQLTDQSMGCDSYGVDSSHERQIVGAGGAELYDNKNNFKDPRFGKEGKMEADRVFVDKNNNIRGVNFSKVENGNRTFACSYRGSDYSSIKAQYKNDLAKKQEETYMKGDVKSAKEQYKLNSAEAKQNRVENKPAVVYNQGGNWRNR